MVARQNISVAVGAGRIVLVPRGVVPGAAGEPNDAGAHGIGHRYAGEALSPPPEIRKFKP
jgi:hypothetical protein